MTRLARSLILVGTLVSVGAYAATPNPVRAFASDAAGNAVQPKLGEPFYATVDFTTLGQDRTFQVKFDSAYTHLSTGALQYGFGYKSGSWRLTWGPFVPLMEGAMAVKVSFVADTVKTTTFTVTPTAPATAIEYYGRKQLQSSMGATWTSGNGMAANWLLPLPATSGFQTVQSMVLPSGTVKTNSTPFNQPVGTQAATSASARTTLQFVTSASSVRVSAAKLQQTTWARETAGVETVWLKPETLIQSSDKNIAAFVKTVLPFNYKTTTTPYASAMKLYLAVIAKLRYQNRAGLPDAATALKTGYGDCGWFSTLFVASCRNAGIPARTVSGFTLGTGEWHVWAEFWIGGAGWVPCDPTYADGIAPNGDLPLYFGIIPDLNNRVATSFGLDCTVGKSKVSMLQSPALVSVSKTATGFVSPTCTLTAASLN